ncbi:hypothetical protein [Streptomyces sp. OR43]|uniref:hypothetical protein n=1 Tax=Streptomyces sp. or43 TaxID=2478957 RepID=UPI0011CE98C2|nr:hypothetical protein [Streptomyces sp. or43]TXS36929.1 hypothetical protein EAO72_26440 [Streptomyces sp. or43]
MPSIRILEAISGADFSWQPGDLVDLPEKQAAVWADGHRAERVEDLGPAGGEGRWPEVAPVVFTADGVELAVLDAVLVEADPDGTPDGMPAAGRWSVTVVWPDDAPPVESVAYDPDEHVSREVLAYLADVGEEEAVRVLDVEAAGQNRAGIAKERDTVLTQARANDEARAAADQEDAELAAEASHGGDLRDGIETR